MGRKSRSTSALRSRSRSRSRTKPHVEDASAALPKRTPRKAAQKHDAPHESPHVKDSVPQVYAAGYSDDVVQIGYISDIESDADAKSRSIRSAPLVIRPNVAVDPNNCGLAVLKEWVKKHQQGLQASMIQHGAVLFRGFDVRSAQDFEDVIALVEPNLQTAYLGTSPRNSVTKYTFTASELPRYFPIPQHLEMSFLPSRPSNIFFCCLHPSKTGGETPVCNFANVYDDLPSEVTDKFEKLGVQYVRNYCGPKQLKVDPLQLKPWPAIFETTDKDAIKEMCNKEKLTCEFGDGDALRLTNRLAAVREHPVLRRKIWSNHLGVFHPSMPAGEFKHIARRTGNPFHWFLWFLMVLMWTVRRLVQRPDNAGMYTCYGDGTPVPQDIIEMVRDATWRNMHIYKWKQGDVILVDNNQVSHGRLPFSGKRSVLVAWGPNTCADHEDDNFSKDWVPN